MQNMMRLQWERAQRAEQFAPSQAVEESAGEEPETEEDESQRIERIRELRERARTAQEDRIRRMTEAQKIRHQKILLIK